MTQLHSRHPVMRSSPEVKVRISAVAGRNCAGAPWGPCSSQSGAVTVGLGSARSCTDVSRVCARLEGFNFESYKDVPGDITCFSNLKARFLRVVSERSRTMKHNKSDPKFYSCSPCKRGNDPGPKKTSGKNDFCWQPGSKQPGSNPANVAFVCM